MQKVWCFQMHFELNEISPVVPYFLGANVSLTGGIMVPGVAKPGLAGARWDRVIYQSWWLEARHENQNWSGCYFCLPFTHHPCLILSPTELYIDCAGHCCTALHHWCIDDWTGLNWSATVNDQDQDLFSLLNNALGYKARQKSARLKKVRSLLIKLPL